MKKQDLTVYVAAFLLLFSCVVHFASAQDKVSEIFKDKYDVKYRITELDSPIQEILWCGTSQATSEDGDIITYDQTAKIRKLYVLTDKGNLYYSEDYGITLKQINDDIRQSTNSKQTQVVVDDIMISPVKNRKVFIFTKSGESYYTENCGATYTSFKHESLLYDIQPNPSDHKSLIGLVPVQCQKGDPECQAGDSDLYLTVDSGVSWKKIVSNVNQAQWDKTKKTLMNTQNRIILSHQEQEKNEKGENIFINKVSYTDNYGKDLRLVEKNGVRFYQTEEYIFVLIQGNEFGKYKLNIGPSYITQSSSRKEIDLPLQRVKDESFTVLDIDGGQILVAINHEGDSAGYTNVYISNSNGEQFNLSLQYTVGDDDSNIDFEPINSNEGVYIANTYTAASISKYQKLLQRKEGQKTSGSQLTLDSFKIENMKKTKITFNKGGDWHQVKAPEYNYAGNPIRCSGDCSLNFKGRTESQGTPVYSTDNAPGIILATGNVGSYLSNNQDELRTYLSTDGGHTWKEIQVGSHEYEIGDQGGIIAMARDDKLTNEVIYSVDEGETWRRLSFRDENKFKVDSFVTEESNDERTFLFYGTKTGQDGNTKGVIGAINFSNLFKRECAGFENPGEDGSDYERWVPLNFEGKKCLFGSKISYIRKKTDSSCFNSRKVGDLRMIQGSCECTEEDFECDYGFTKDLIDETKCVPINAKFAKKRDQPPLNCKDYYFVSSGKRKIANNSCQGGIEELYAKKKVRCPGTEEAEQTKQQTQNTQTNSAQNNQQDLFNRKPEEIKKEIREQYGNQTDQQSGISFLGVLAAFLVLFLLYTYRVEILAKIKEYQQNQKNKKGDHNKYGYKQSNGNNAEQYSLFQNDQDNDEYDADML
ncbi:hypothetical protein ABPG74_005899 [Tetrahymena malaccensis]